MVPKRFLAATALPSAAAKTISNSQNWTSPLPSCFKLVSYLVWIAWNKLCTRLAVCCLFCIIFIYILFISFSFFSFFGLILLCFVICSVWLNNEKVILLQTFLVVYISRCFFCTSHALGLGLLQNLFLLVFWCGKTCWGLWYWIPS